MRRLSKKITGLFMAVLMLTAMTVPAFAASSPVAGSESPSFNQVNPTKITVNNIIVNGKEYAVGLGDLADAVKKEVNTNDKLISLLGSSYIANSKIEQLGAYDLELPEGLTEEQLAAGVDVTFNVPAAKTGDIIKILHKRAIDNKWEVLDTVVSDGTVKATFHSFSPVVFVRMTPSTTPASSEQTNPSAKGTSQGTTTAATTNLASPKTGMPVAFYAFSVIAVVSLVGLAVVSRKKAA